MIPMRPRFSRIMAGFALALALFSTGHQARAQYGYPGGYGGYGWGGWGSGPTVGGSPASGLGWFFPSSHLAELLGGTPRTLSPHAHFAWLYGLALGYAALAVWRTRAAAPPKPI